MQVASRNPLDATPMSGRQILIIALAVVLAALDGFDALSMAFVAPALGKAWSLGRATTGLLLSSGLVGMALGSLLISPSADVVGRKPVILGGLFLMTAGSLMSAAAESVVMLAGSRVFTGLGIGVMIALTTSIAGEFSNSRRRPLAISITTVGLAVGGVVGGLVAAALLHSGAWQRVFMVGAVAGGCLLASVAVALPESPAYLIARQPPRALIRLNRVLDRLAQPRVTQLPPAPLRNQVSYKVLFAPGMTAVTLRLAAVQILVVTSASYIASWLPQFVSDAGFPVATASLVSAVGGGCGIVGALLFGALATRVGPPRLAAFTMVATGVSLASLGLVPPVLILLFMTAGAAGFFGSGGIGVFYAALSASFAPLSRTSGLGFVMGVGRAFSAVGPAAAGWLFAQGFTRGQVSLAVALGPLLAGVLLTSLPSAEGKPQSINIAG